MTKLERIESKEDRLRRPPQKFLIVWRTAAGYMNVQASGDTREAADNAAREMTRRRGIPHWIVEVVGVAREGEPVVEDVT